MNMLHMNWSGRQVPHALLDILRGCNIRCRHCYNLAPPYCKSLAEIAAELDTLLQLRQLQAVSISGGEPLLHPELTEIIRMIRQRGVAAAIVTNGLLLTQEKALEYKAAGCDLVFVHIQHDQIRRDLPFAPTAGDIHRLRAEKTAHLLDAGITPGWALTLEDSDHDGLRDFLAAYAEAPGVQYVLLSVARDFRAEALSDEETDAAALLRIMGETPRPFLPFTWLGGRFQPEIPRWFAFHSVRTRERWHAFRVSGLERLYLGICRLLRRRVPFIMKPSRRLLLWRSFLNGLTGGGREAAAFAWQAWRRREAVETKHVILEIPPVRLADGRIECCADCPDAVVRGGKLYPACLADYECGPGNEERTPC